MSKRYLETIKSVDGHLFNLEYHQSRLDSVLNSSNHYNLQSLLSPPKDGTYRCRVVYDESTIEVEYFSYKKRIIKTLKLIYEDNIEYCKKYENRDSINKLFLKKEGCDDILIVKNGLITDTSIANIAFYDGEYWFTPKHPLLAGTTRKRLLDTGSLIEKEIFIKDLKTYKQVALMNAMIDFDIIAQKNIEDMIC